MKYSERESRRFCINSVVSDPRMRLPALVRFGSRHIRERFCRIPTYELEELYRDMNPGDLLSMPSAALATIPMIAGLDQAFSLDNLSPADRSVLVSHICVSTDISADSTLEEALEQTGMSPVALYHSLRHSSDIRLMIAAAALRSVKRLPPDPRLSPAPHKPAPVRSPRTPEEAARRAHTVAVSEAAVGRYLISVAPNPKRAGSASWDRYELYTIGLDRAQLLAAGLKTADFKYDTEKGYISWSDTHPDESADLQSQADDQFIADQIAADAKENSDDA